MTHKNYQCTISLQLKDIQELKEKGKICSDFQVALQMMEEDLKNEHDTLSLVSILSYSDSVPLELINQFRELDDLEKRDREMALRLSSNKDKAMNQTNQTLLKSFQNMSLSKVTSSHIASCSKDLNPSGPFFRKDPQSNLVAPLEEFKSDPPIANETANQSESESSKKDDDTDKVCISCFGENEIKVACGHYYCKDCLKQVCLGAISDISFFPARCCKQVISQELIQSVLDENDYNRYKQKQIDISDIDIKNMDPEFHKMVTSMGWRVCPGCGAGIEKTQDCNHMTCIICKFQFCYRCNAHWIPRKCKCELWVPGELERILNEVAPRANVQERNRLRDVYRHHDTHQHRWTKLDIVGRYKRCRNCDWVCNQWYEDIDTHRNKKTRYWRCDGCSTNMCGRCAHNRN